MLSALSQGENLSKIAEKVQSLLEVTEKEFDKVRKMLSIGALLADLLCITSAVEVCNSGNGGTNTLLIRG